MRHFLAFVVAIAMVIAAAGLKAQSRTGSAPPPGPDMSGLWLVQDPGSGSWSAWFNNVPKPALRAAIIKDNGEIEAREAAGNVVNTMPRRPDCPVGNLPMMMASSPPLNIVAARDEVLIAAESGRGRFIYTDGRPHRTRKPRHTWRAASDIPPVVGRATRSRSTRLAFPPACATAVAR